MLFRSGAAVETGAGLSVGAVVGTAVGLSVGAVVGTAVGLTDAPPPLSESERAVEFSGAGQIGSAASCLPLLSKTCTSVHQIAWPNIRILTASVSASALHSVWIGVAVTKALSCPLPVTSAMEAGAVHACLSESHDWNSVRSGA